METRNTITFSEILSLVEQKANRFGKVDYTNRVCRKKQTKSRIALVSHLILLTTILDYEKQGYNIEIETYQPTSYRIIANYVTNYMNELELRYCPFYKILSAFTKKAINGQVNNETLLLEIMQITMFRKYGKRYYENMKRLQMFFFEDSKIGLDSLIHEFNRETIENKQAQRKEMYEKMKLYQKNNSEKINKYNRDKNKTRISNKELKERNIQWNVK